MCVCGGGCDCVHFGTFDEDIAAVFAHGCVYVCISLFHIYPTMLYVCISLCMHVCVRMCTYVHAYMRSCAIHTYIHAYMLTYTQTCIHTCTHTCTHTHTHTFMQDAGEVGSSWGGGEARTAVGVAAVDKLDLGTAAENSFSDDDPACVE